MPQEGRHHLEVFINRTFGDHMGAILLAGYGEEVGLRETSIVVVAGATQGGREREWLIGITGDIPCGEEPLVLAALLKLLLTRGPLSVWLDFTFEEVLAELGWQDRRFAQDAVDSAVRKYAALSYARKGAGEEARGMYALVVGYDQVTDGVNEGGSRTRVLNRVHFHPRFVEGLRNFRMEFAGIAFGELRSVEYYRTIIDSVM